MNRTAWLAASTAVLLALAVPTTAIAEPGLPHPGLKLSTPIAVRANSAFTARGSVVGTLAPGETVTVVMQRKTGGGWSSVWSTRVTPTSAGAFSARFSAGSRGHWRAVASVDGTTTHLASSSPAFAFKVVGKKVVALTFDDGPQRSSTDRIVATLKRYDAQATFFMLGAQVKGQRARAKSVVAAGNLAGVHSWNHAILPRRSRTAVKKDLKRTRDTIASATGKRPTWFRPPYGSTNKSVAKVAKGLGLRQVIWNVDTLDWRYRSASSISSRAIRGTRNGSVVLMHDGGGPRSATVKAVPVIINALRKKGYDFVTLDELVALGYRVR